MIIAAGTAQTNAMEVKYVWMVVGGEGGTVRTASPSPHPSLPPPVKDIPQCGSLRTSHGSKGGWHIQAAVKLCHRWERHADQLATQL